MLLRMHLLKIEISQVDCYFLFFRIVENELLEYVRNFVESVIFTLTLRRACILGWTHNFSLENILQPVAHTELLVEIIAVQLILKCVCMYVIKMGLRNMRSILEFQQFLSFFYSERILTSITQSFYQLSALERGKSTWIAALVQFRQNTEIWNICNQLGCIECSTFDVCVCEREFNAVQQTDIRIWFKFNSNRHVSPTIAFILNKIWRHIRFQIQYHLLRHCLFSLLLIYVFIIQRTGETLLCAHSKIHFERWKKNQSNDFLIKVIMF